MIFSRIRRMFAAAPHIERLPAEQVQRLYPWYRWQIMESTFLGYAMYYLVRNNLSVVTEDLSGELHYDYSDIGVLLGTLAISYGVGKFIMGAISDRSNPRIFMSFGLLLTALCNFAFGSVTNYTLHLFLWAINGFVQGMGWPPCGRSMGHWFAEKERGLTFSIWNTSHNLGGGVAGIIAGWAASPGGWPLWALRFSDWAASHGADRIAAAAAWAAGSGGWQNAFFFPGALALIGAVYLLWRLRDTPQSVGLPPIEEYKDGFCPNPDMPLLPERELTYRELLIDKVLTNRYVWLLAIANLFAYIARYSMLDWGPMYLRQVKGATVVGGGWAILMLEFGGIPSTILLGWISDLLKGRRGMVAVLCCLPILVAFGVILLTPPGYLWLDMLMLVAVGFFVYPVINFIVIIALDLTSKKAIGTAAGFIGLFGYIGRMIQAKGFGWTLSYFEPLYGKETAWEIVIYAILACTAIGMLLLVFTWRLRPIHARPQQGLPVVSVAKPETEES